VVRSTALNSSDNLPSDNPLILLRDAIRSLHSRLLSFRLLLQRCRQIVQWLLAGYQNASWWKKRRLVEWMEVGRTLGVGSDEWAVPPPQRKFFFEFSSKRCRALCIFIAKKLYLWSETGWLNWPHGAEDVKRMGGGSTPSTLRQLSPFWLPNCCVCCAVGSAQASQLVTAGATGSLRQWK